MNALLEVEDLVVDIPIPSGLLHPVREISFHVDYGETLCIVGESGCGKTTLAKILLGLERQTSCKIDIQGKFHNFLGAQIVPSPVQKPHPPLWFGVRGRRML